MPILTDFNARCSWSPNKTPSNLTSASDDRNMSASARHPSDVVARETRPRTEDLLISLRLVAVLHLTPYFYNWPVRMWPICRPEGAVGTYSPWCRGHWPYNIPWPLCSRWWADNWPHGAPGTDPPEIGVLECARSRAGARSTTWELGTFLLHTNHLRTAQVF